MRLLTWASAVCLLLASVFAQDRKLHDIVKEATELKGWTANKPRGNVDRPGSEVALEFSAAKGHGYVNFVVLRYATPAAAKKVLGELRTEDGRRKQTFADYSATEATDSTWPWRLQKGRCLVFATISESHPERGEQAPRWGVGMPRKDFKRLVKRLLDAL